MAKRIVLKNYRKTFEGISEGIGSPQCARLVQAVEKAELGCVTPVSSYTGTVKVRDCPSIEPGTVIATLLDGRYPNEAEGNHVAIFVSKTTDGLKVFDQYAGKPPGERVIRYKGAKVARGDKTRKDGSLAKDVLLMSNDADFYYAIEA